MIVINEWLPNPAGSDAEGEWIELLNAGMEAVSLAGWHVGTSPARTVALRSKTLAVGEHALIPRSATKLALKNQNGMLLLYDPGGALRDEARFLGDAPEGKSVMRTATGKFLFGTPTPGSENVFLASASLVERTIPAGIPLHGVRPWSNSMALGLIAAAVLTGAAIVIIKRNRDLSELFFNRNA